MPLGLFELARTVQSMQLRAKYHFEDLDARTKERILKRLPQQGEGCWEFQGAKDGDGYGTIGAKINGKNTTLRAHRMAWEAYVGKIPKNMFVDHVCRNTACYRWDSSHLRIVSHKDNVLAGISPMALRAAATECAQGHDLTDPSNVKVFTSGVKANSRLCKPCLKTRVAKSNERNRDKILAQGRASYARYYEKNKEAILERNKPRQAAWYQANKQRLKEERAKRKNNAA